MKNKNFRIVKRLAIYFFIITLFINPVVPNNIYPLSTIVNAATNVMKPSANLGAGIYTGAQKIKLSCKTKGATIYYTTNGTKPTVKSKKYTKAFQISKSSVVKAIAIKNKIKSQILTRYYVISSFNIVSDDVERYQKAIENNQESTLSQADQEVCANVEAIIAEVITDDMSDYDKVKAIHDFIINNTKYDTVNYDNNSIPDVSFAIEGVILNHIAVCQGYAETFELFMNLLGIENKIITGYGNGIPHAWNLVRLDSKWYHVDTTWDDPISESGEDNLIYNYFLIDDKQMSISHIWQTENYPECVSDDLMYKIYDGCIIDSITDYQAKFTELYKKGQRTITILYPENQKPDLQFYFKLSNANRVNYSMGSEKFGDYYVFTVYAQ